MAVATHLRLRPRDDGGEFQRQAAGPQTPRRRRSAIIGRRAGIAAAREFWTTSVADLQMTARAAAERHPVGNPWLFTIQP